MSAVPVIGPLLAEVPPHKPARGEAGLHSHVWARRHGSLENNWLISPSSGVPEMQNVTVAAVAVRVKYFEVG